MELAGRSCRWSDDWNSRVSEEGPGLIAATWPSEGEAMLCTPLRHKEFPVLFFLPFFGIADQSKGTSDWASQGTQSPHWGLPCRCASLWVAEEGWREMGLLGSTEPQPGRTKQSSTQWHYASPQPTAHCRHRYMKRTSPQLFLRCSAKPCQGVRTIPQPNRNITGNSMHRVGRRLNREQRWGRITQRPSDILELPCQGIFWHTHTYKWDTKLIRHARGLCCSKTIANRLVWDVIRAVAFWIQGRQHGQNTFI